MRVVVLKKELFGDHQKNTKSHIGQAEGVHFQRMIKQNCCLQLFKVANKKEKQTKCLNAFTTFAKRLLAKRCFVFFFGSIYMSSILTKNTVIQKKKQNKHKILLLTVTKQFPNKKTTISASILPKIKALQKSIIINSRLKQTAIKFNAHLKKKK